MYNLFISAFWWTMQSTNCPWRESPKRALEDCSNPLAQYKWIYRVLSYSKNTWHTWLDPLQGWIQQFVWLVSTRKNLYYNKINLGNWCCFLSTKAKTVSKLLSTIHWRVVIAEDKRQGFFVGNFRCMVSHNNEHSGLFNFLMICPNFFAAFFRRGELEQ